MDLPTFTHLDKMLWPEAGINKARYIQYILEMAPFLLSHLKGRPLTLIRFPQGIHGKSFYQKNAPPETPSWVDTYTVVSGQRTIRYILANNLETLAWLANQDCLEFHPWFSLSHAPESPTQLAFDLDPSLPGFERVREVALNLHEVLVSLGFPAYVKTSGASGLQIYVPLARGYTYQDTRLVTAFIARYMTEKYPALTTLARRVRDRGHKVYIDYVQHAPHKTLIAPYSPRAVREARVSAPLTWEELKQGAVPDDFTQEHMVERVKKLGDLFAPLAQPGVELEDFLRVLRRFSQKTGWQ